MYKQQKTNGQQKIILELPEQKRITGEARRETIIDRSDIDSKILKTYGSVNPPAHQRHNEVYDVIDLIAIYIGLEEAKLVPQEYWNMIEITKTLEIRRKNLMTVLGATIKWMEEDPRYCLKKDVYRYFLIIQKGECLGVGDDQVNKLIRDIERAEGLNPFVNTYGVW